MPAMPRPPLTWTTPLALVLLAAPPAPADDAGPALSVDAAAGRHRIDPDVYGMASPDPAVAREIRLPLQRWGGDSATRYNWQIDSTNAGEDWYYTSGGKLRPTPSGGPDKVVTDVRGCGGRALITIPIIDYVNKIRAWDCSFPVAEFGRQQKVNPYVHPTYNGSKTDAGNGKTADGKQLTLTRDQVLRTHMVNTPAFQQAWVQHLVQQFGTTAAGGVGAYELDNEPSGWCNTHRDVHPDQTGDDELVTRSLAYAAAIKAADPSALVIGPGDFVMHYQGDGKPGDGKKEHGGLGQGDYYLRSFAAHDRAHGNRRLLDYFDEHYYPFDQDGRTDQTEIDQTRSLWDPTYVERNWWGKYHGAKALLPTFHKWVDANYPGTKLAISEYGWGDPKKVSDAIAEADVLGIFGRERLDMACLWYVPKAGDVMANSFRIYRNYDGRGGQYGDTWVRSASDDQARVSVYAAVRSADGALTVVTINKTDGPLTSHVALTGFGAASTAAAFRFDGDHPKAVAAVADQPVAADGFDAALPAKSVTIYVLRPA